MAFTRRFNFYPGTGVISQIEGVVIIRTTPPSPIQGVNTGVACCVGEFQDATYGIAVSSLGEITSNPNPQAIFTSQDQLNFTGGFDETIGNFGGDMGNGFVELANKQFAALVLAPIDNVSPATLDSSSQPMHSYGVRMWRQLPTNISATNPNPIVPVTAATVAAGTQFIDGSNYRVRVAAAFAFGGQAAYLTGTDGSVTHTGSAAAAQTFTSAGSNFTTAGAKAGDLLVLGVIGGASGLGANAATYRVTVVGTTTLTVELLAATNFDWSTGTTASMPWRLHVAAAGDSAGVFGNHLALVQTTGAGYQVAMRPLDASIAIDAALTPSVVPAAGTATSWNPLSGLTARSNHVDGSGASTLSISIIYDANIHAPNTADTAALDARYSTAIAACLQPTGAPSTIDMIWAARKSSAIASALYQHELTANSQGLSRRALIAPSMPQGTNPVASTQSAIAATYPGVGGQRDYNLDYSWPYCQTSIPQAVGFSLAGADGSIVTNGILDTTSEGWLAAVESNIPPENNPGQAAPPVPQILSPIVGLGRGVPVLQMSDYIALKAAGICGMIIDPVTGPQFQSGVTTSLITGQQDIAGSRMSDFIEDSIAAAMKPFINLNQTTELIELELGEIVGFLENLKSTNNPAAQRIVDYSVDPTSGNTQALTALGITVFIIQVQLLQAQKNLVLQTEIGAGVVVTQAISNA
jgi:hypothetical protein